MERKFKTPYSSIDDENPVAEIVRGVSETVPDQSLTVREILDKFANGTLDEIGNDRYYNDDVDGYDMPDLRGLDITELQQMKRDAQMDIDEIQAMIDLHEDVVQTPTKKKVKSDSSPTDTLTTETPDHI
ncbi:hypothetical protein [Elizabethkingia anophelis]|uniref:hypothetical protein n=1 Tax=Elizabethkingia anophelis TaxID=1117645 RepID=UPI0011EA739E|nr:hypothetical protein [Elizabethkingia anophelis]TYT29965.1 hypothetical protein FZC31_07035 [Elizabethkingia anophelis]UKY90267.1 hypothetical protein KUF64_00690 [Elizabethkingia anophelis]UKY97436.1 hypothetical protein KUF68_00690 [Elizabethkingia anophelis]